MWLVRLLMRVARPWARGRQRFMVGPSSTWATERTRSPRSRLLAIFEALSEWFAGDFHGCAFVKAFQAAGIKLPRSGRIFLSVRNADKRAILSEGRTLAARGYELLATDGTYRALKTAGVPVRRVNKVHEGRPHIVDMIKNREIDLVLNTPYGKQQRADDSSIRAAAVNAGIPCITTLAGIRAIVNARASGTARM